MSNLFFDSVRSTTDMDSFINGGAFLWFAHGVLPVLPGPRRGVRTCLSFCLSSELPRCMTTVPGLVPLVVCGWPTAGQGLGQGQGRAETIGDKRTKALEMARMMSCLGSDVTVCAHLRDSYVTECDIKNFLKKIK